MIQCKDFAPRITERGPFGGTSDYQSFAEVVDAANQWIEMALLHEEGLVVHQIIVG